MDEHFDFDARPADDGAYVVQRQLARQHDTREAEFLERQYAFEIVRHELRGSVQSQAGKVLAHQSCDAEILDDQTVWLEFVENGQLFDGRGQFGIVDERVEGDVCLFALRPRDGQQLPELVGREIDGFGARGEGVQAEIDGIRARREGSERGFESAGRRKQLMSVMPMHILP